MAVSRNSRVAPWSPTIIVIPLLPPPARRPTARQLAAVKGIEATPQQGSGATGRRCLILLMESPCRTTRPGGTGSCGRGRTGGPSMAYPLAMAGNSRYCPPDSRKGKEAAMELTGSRRIAADRQEVWEALNDPEVLKASVPGCQELTGSAEEGFEAVVKQKVGPVSATFRGSVQLTNIVAGESYTISGEGKGGAAGFARGGADVRLEDAEEGGTLLTYDVNAVVGGKLAQLGSRIIDGFAKKMADQFF